MSIGARGAPTGPVADAMTTILEKEELAGQPAANPGERLLIVCAVVPLFAFANAGLPLSWGDLGHSVTWAVFVGFALGKPIGVVGASLLAYRQRRFRLEERAVGLVNLRIDVAEHLLFTPRSRPGCRGKTDRP